LFYKHFAGKSLLFKDLAASRPLSLLFSKTDIGGNLREGAEKTIMPTFFTAAYSS
jgi:hypothetical protein